jgi:hypothetical protein
LRHIGFIYLRLPPFFFDPQAIGFYKKKPQMTAILAVGAVTIGCPCGLETIS